jgi:hypothetical protein
MIIALILFFIKAFAELVGVTITRVDLIAAGLFFLALAIYLGK